MIAEKSFLSNLIHPATEQRPSTGMPSAMPNGSLPLARSTMPGFSWQTMRTRPSGALPKCRELAVRMMAIGSIGPRGVGNPRSSRPESPNCSSARRAVATLATGSSRPRMSLNSTTSRRALKAARMFRPIGNCYTDIVTTPNLPLNIVSRHQRGLIVTHPIVEEPDEGKLSRPVL